MKFKNFLQGPVATILGMVVVAGSLYAMVFIPGVEGWHVGLGCLVGLLLWFSPDPPTITNLLISLIDALKKKFL